jgi:hypothetical protein
MDTIPFTESKSATKKPIFVPSLFAMAIAGLPQTLIGGPEYAKVATTGEIGGFLTS